MSKTAEALCEIESRAIAIADLTENLHAACFSWSLGGLLKTDHPTDYNPPKEQQERAFKWVFDNYDRLAATIYATRQLAEDIVAECQRP